MPLSEEEQRILQEIERSFYESDPAFAREVSAASAQRTAARNAKLAIAGFAGGLILLISSFASNVVLGFVGFVVMLASAFVLQSQLRHLGPAGLAGAARTGAKVGDALGGARERVKGKIRRPGDRRDRGDGDR